jgi:DNA-binding XRE family transcriptional regulator
MKDEELFRDREVIQVITPYQQLRKLRGWSQDKAAEIFQCSKHLLVDIENGRRDPPKWLVRAMDRVYGCNGKLIEYWLPKFSTGPGWIETIKKLLR